MAKQEYEFTLILSGVKELTSEVLDALYEVGCDDALVGMRDGVAFADFSRTADSLREALLSAIRDVEAAGIGARVEHIEPDELVTMSEIARRLRITREAVRKRVAGLRGPGSFPSPAGSLTSRSPLWRWSDVVRWHGQNMEGADVVYLTEDIATTNAALELLRRVPHKEAVRLLQSLRTTATQRPSTRKRHSPLQKKTAQGSGRDTPRGQE